MKWRSLEESTAAVDMRPLREQFAERKQLIAKYVPVEAQAIHARVIAELQQSGMVNRILPVGAMAPAFELPAHNGAQVSSSDLLGRQRLVICFFRGRWCPFCVGQLEAMNQILSGIERAGACLVAVSPQDVRQSFFMADQHRLRFPLLSDAHNQLARQFGLVYPVPEDQQQIYRRAFVNLPFVNGDDGWELPIPATYILNRDSAVLYAWASPDYMERPEPADILEALRGN